MTTTPKNVLLTGPPGCGKTTVVRRVIEQLGDRCLAGFYTQEIRQCGGRKSGSGNVLDAPTERVTLRWSFTRCGALSGSEPGDCGEIPAQRCTPASRRRPGTLAGPRETRYSCRGACAAQF